MEKKLSIFLIILLCILVAVAGGSLSYAYLNKAHEDEKQSLEDQIDSLESQVTKLRNESKVTPTPTITPTTTTTTTTDPTANWQTFSNFPAFKIKIKYPSTWTIDSKSSTPGDESETYIQRVITFKSEDNQTYKLYYPALQIAFTQYTLGNEKVITSSKGIKFNRSYGSKTDNTAGMLYYALTKDATEINENSVLLLGQNNSISNSTIEILDNMLSTFEFED